MASVEHRPTRIKGLPMGTEKTSGRVVVITGGFGALARFSHTAIPGSPASPARRGAGAGFDALDDIVVKPIA